MNHPYTRQELLDVFEALHFRVRLPQNESAKQLLGALEAWKKSRRHLETGWYVPLIQSAGGMERTALGHVHLLAWWVEPQSDGPGYVAILLKYVGSANRFAQVKDLVAAGHLEGKLRLPFMVSIEVLSNDVLGIALIPDIGAAGEPAPRRPRARNRNR